MSKKSKTSVGRKADSKKVNKFKTTPLIVVIAIVEVIVLIATVTFAWFKLAENNSVDSGLISVAPDSGLKIDFHDANKSSYINIHNYLHNFTFEPATSLDGRNIYFPTTGTFEKDDTKDIVFREGTVNDCNSKYIAVDFTLTNSDTTNAKQVFLDNSSTFDIAGSGAANPSGKALRIAFYQNDNKSGKVNSTALTDLSNDAETNVYTIFFYDSLGWFSGDEVPYVHIWRESDNDSNLSSDDAFDTFPGKPMKRIAGELYYFSFNNRKDSTDNYYDSVLFCDGKNSPTYRTVDLAMSKDHLYTPDGTKDGNNYYNAPDKRYSSLVSDEGYAVIAPGISAGFQRPYAPVTEIDNTSGKATTVVPAYAYSIDEYFNLDAGGLFTIAPRETQSLTMIIWLEGTDPDCTASTYSGAEVDLNLVFSVKGSAEDNSARENTLIYRFYDFTKETWIKNPIDDNGLTFKPVIQLYDVDKGRGYLMHLVSGYNNTRWEVEAPAGITGDSLEFRRVNPSDENEVWNVWDASEIKIDDVFDIIKSEETITVDGVSQTKKVIPFTAFADGAPSSNSSSAYYLSAGASASAPAHSCGGLWGYHPVTNFTFVDGTNDIYLSQNNGLVTMEYTYYFSNGVKQTIEYKASGPDYGAQFYRFVVPKELVNASVGISRSSGEEYNSAADGVDTPTYKFKRYYNSRGSSYAPNIPSKNPNITYDKTFTINSVMTGTCAMTTGNGSYDSNYFGTQLAYVQIGCTDYDNGQRSNLFKSKATFLAKFWSDYDGNVQIQNVRLRTPNGQWAGSDYKGFAVVVPSGTAQWSVWRYDENYYTIWNYPYKGGNRDMRTNFVSNNNLFKLHNFKDKNTNNDIYYDVSTTSWQKYGNY